jgi:hypothetical protein
MSAVVASCRLGEFGPQHIAVMAGAGVLILLLLLQVIILDVVDEATAAEVVVVNVVEMFVVDIF